MVEHDGKKSQIKYHWKLEICYEINLKYCKILYNIEK